jgi:hypothetical protein
MNELPGALAAQIGVAEQTWPHTIDAGAWADQWLKITANKPREAFNDRGWILGWFANAIMAGYDTANFRMVQTAVERDKLRAALREEAIRWTQDLSGRTEQMKFCNRCLERWKPDEPEKHAPECLVAEPNYGQ